MKLSALEKFILDLLGRRLTLRLIRISFIIAVLVTFVCAILPETTAPHIGFIPWDKALHFIAFVVLTVMAGIAFPAASVLVIAASLSAFGALIEVVQGLDFIARDSDFWDWVADTLAIGTVVIAMLVARWRIVYNDGPAR